MLWFHGKGGINLEGWGGLPNYAFHQRMVQQGYSIVFVNWRGTHIGYGSEWERANYRDYAGGELDDAVAAARDGRLQDSKTLAALLLAAPHV